MKKGKHGLRFLSSVFAVCILLCAWLGIPASAEAEVYRSVETESNRIALTFDDGPHPFLTPRILEILERYHVSATFFMVGRNVCLYPEAARAVIAAGHEVGNHTFSHLHVKRLSLEALGDELGGCEDALEELCEYRPHLFRPPEGAVNSYVHICSERGDYTLVLWSLDTRDWEVKDADAISKAVLDKIRPGDIILMHDYIGHNSRTPEALEKLLPQLLARGYEPVTVSQLLGEG